MNGTREQHARGRQAETVLPREGGTRSPGYARQEERDRQDPIRRKRAREYASWITSAPRPYPFSCRGRTGSDQSAVETGIGRLLGRSRDQVPIPRLRRGAEVPQRVSDDVAGPASRTDDDVHADPEKSRVGLRRVAHHVVVSDIMPRPPRYPTIVAPIFRVVVRRVVRVRSSSNRDGVRDRTPGGQLLVLADRLRPVHRRHLPEESNSVVQPFAARRANCSAMNCSPTPTSLRIDRFDQVAVDAVLRARDRHGYRRGRPASSVSRTSRSPGPVRTMFHRGGLRLRGVTESRPANLSIAQILRPVVDARDSISPGLAMMIGNVPRYVTRAGLRRSAYPRYPGGRFRPGGIHWDLSASTPRISTVCAENAPSPMETSDRRGLV